MLKVLVRDREGIKFNGSAQYISSVNSVGSFDILAGHSNFISLIRKKVAITEPGGKRTGIQFGVGCDTSTER